MNITLNKILITFNTAVLLYSKKCSVLIQVDRTEYRTLIGFISNFAVNSMRVSIELYYVDVRNEFALDALRTLSVRCGCSFRENVGRLEMAARMWLIRPYSSSRPWCGKHMV